MYVWLTCICMCVRLMYIAENVQRHSRGQLDRYGIMYDDGFVYVIESSRMEIFLAILTGVDALVDF